MINLSWWRLYIKNVHREIILMMIKKELKLEKLSYRYVYKDASYAFTLRKNGQTYKFFLGDFCKQEIKHTIKDVV